MLPPRAAAGRPGDRRGLFLDVPGLGMRGKQEEDTLLELALAPEVTRMRIGGKLGSQNAARAGPRSGRRKSGGSARGRKPGDGLRFGDEAVCHVFLSARQAPAMHDRSPGGGPFIVQK